MLNLSQPKGVVLLTFLVAPLRLFPDTSKPYLHVENNKGKIKNMKVNRNYISTVDWIYTRLNKVFSSSHTCTKKIAGNPLPVIIIQVVAHQSVFKQWFPMATGSNYAPRLTCLLGQEVVSVPATARVQEGLTVLSLVVVEPSCLTVIAVTWWNQKYYFIF